jgi:squalene-hopene/tetraprenyl-beta-curcumene cyclase
MASSIVGARSEAAVALERACEHLLSLQDEAGWWKGELQTNATMDAEDMLLREFLGIRQADQTERSAAEIRSQQRPDGTWTNFHDGPGELSTSIEAYWALRLAGDPADAEHMRAAASFIRAQGGLQNARVFTHVWLALFGLWPWEHVPALPPEIVLLPAWVPLNVYDFACWARQTIVALSLVMAHRPCREMGFDLDELHGPEPWTPRESVSRRGAWLARLDRALRMYERRPIRPLRRLAVARAERWVVRRQEADGSWGGIQPPWVYSLMALHLSGYALDHPLMRRGLEGLDGFMIEDRDEDRDDRSEIGRLGAGAPAGVGGVSAGVGGVSAGVGGVSAGAGGVSAGAGGVSAGAGDVSAGVGGAPAGASRRLEACQSPVWDTAMAMIALGAAGVSNDHPALVRAAQWLLGEEVRVRGDWAVARPRLKPSGWAFEFANVNYPDVDDTAEVVIALRHAARSPLAAGAAAEVQETIEGAIARGVRWVEGMQSSDGGWGAFDADNTRSLVREMPFLDFGEVIDEPSADVTAHAVEMLAVLGLADGAAARAGVRWLIEGQELDGSWWGRWGVNHVYGTGAAVPALIAAGVAPSARCIRRAVDWLEAHQNEDGGWGEDPRSYDDEEWIGRGPSTASQTAWALLALHAAGEERSKALARGVSWLVATQRSDGTWDEPQYTGTGFPSDYYINYHLYRLTFPIIALARCEGGKTA